MPLHQLLLLLPLFVFSSGALAQRAISGEDCFSLGGQADARTCLEKRVLDSDVALKNTEEDVLGHVHRWDDTPANRRRVHVYVLSSGKQYLRYRKEQCELQAALAAGGTGGSHRRFLCILELNEQRMAHLQSVKEVTKR
ncbi:MAG: lysozyme inhibitor LprI family protein [Pseudomonadota bacterium]